MNFNPAHVTYLDDATRNRPGLGLNGDHAYWVSQITPRNPNQTGAGGDLEAKIDAVSHGFGTGDPGINSIPLGGFGTLTGGTLGPLTFTPNGGFYGATPAAPRADRIDITATNVASVAVDVRRAHVDCKALVNVVRTDGPVKISLPGCRRVVLAG